MNKKAYFFIDDTIWAFRDIARQKPASIFDQPFLALMKEAHDKYGMKVQLNLFYECEGFCLSDMTDRYKDEWADSADWLKMSFHSRLENVRPYEESGFGEVFLDCFDVNGEIRRFAGENSLAKTTTIHYCALTDNGIDAVKSNGYKGLLGLYSTGDSPRVSYQNSTDEAEKLVCGELVERGGITYGAIDIVLNLFTKEENLRQISSLLDRSLIKIMIHEQYFYEDYRRYIPDFEEILSSSFELLTNSGYKSEFLEKVI